MRKAVVVLLAVFLIGAFTADAAITLKKTVGDKDLKVKLFGFQQMEMRGGEGYNNDDDGVFFRAQRVRVGWKFYYGKTMGKLFMDFNKSFEAKGAGLPEAVKDAFVGYRWSNAAMLRLGMIKTPLGMAFTIPGWNLDNMERNKLDKGLVLERDFGLILSGRIIGDPDMKTDGTEMGHERQGKGFGYDIGIFNHPGRSAALRDKSGKLGIGDTLTYVFRIHYDNTDKFHFEAAYGSVEAPMNVGETGFGSEDYDVYDVGVNSFLGDWNLKFEYIHGENIQFQNGRSQECMTLTVARMLAPQTEAVLKHYAASTDYSGDFAMTPDTDLSNTYLGLNFYIEPLKFSHRKLQNHKVSVFYVMTSGDDDGDWTGKWGYQDDVWMTQWQWKW
jgi:hypothetical protein